MDLNALTSEITAALGQKVIVTSECGLAVFNDGMQLLFSTSKLPKTVTAEWVCQKITSRDATAAKLKARREAGIAKLRSELIAKGVRAFSVYETTFGFSVCNLFGDGIAKAREIISACEIDAKRIEYSEAHWVVRVIL